MIPDDSEIHPEIAGISRNYLELMLLTDQRCCITLAVCNLEADCAFGKIIDPGGVRS